MAFRDILGPFGLHIPNLRLACQILQMSNDTATALVSSLNLFVEQKNVFSVDLSKVKALPDLDGMPSFIRRRFELNDMIVQMLKTFVERIKGFIEDGTINLVLANTQHFSSEDYKKKQFLFKYLEFCNALFAKIYGTARRIISLAATFNLFDPDAIEADDETAASCLKRLQPFIDLDFRSISNNTPAYYNDIQTAISHLSNIKKPDPALTLDVLVQFFKSIKQIPAPKTVLDLVEEQFGTYFPSDYFKQVRNGELSAELVKLAKEGIPSEEDQELIIAILIRFLFQHDDEQLKKLCQTLKLLLRGLSQSEANAFLRMFANNNALYEGKPKPLADDLCKLLQATMDSNNHSELMCLLTEAEQSHVTNNLMTMAREYLSRVLPHLKQVENRQLRRNEILALARRFTLVAENVSVPGDITNAMIDSTMRLASKFPVAKNEIFDFFPQLFQECLASSNDAEKAFEQFSRAQIKIFALKNERTVFSLSYHFSQGKDGLKPSDLLSVLGHANFKALSSERRALLLNIICLLLNNNQAIDIKDITAMLDRCDNEKYTNNIFLILKNIYKRAPFPSFSTVMQWVKSAKTGADLKKFHQAFDIQPCEREFTDGVDGVNGFYMAKAKKQALQFEGYTFYKEELESLNQHVKAVRSLSTQQLLDTFHAQGSASDRDTALFVALAAELLYRAKGLPAIGDGEDREWGRSFEINTTQYLAIYTALQSGTHVTAQVETSEGKTREFMILAACKHALGKTTDFVTSDMTLARREFTEYSSYFNLLGAKTALIHADSPATLYEMEGINLSDDANLNLFRNKARSECLEHKVLNPDKTKRALLHDEGDKPYYDMAETRFNFSSRVMHY